MESEAQPLSPYALSRSSHVWQQGCVGDSAPKQDGHFSFLGIGALLAVACVGVLILFPNLSSPLLDDVLLHVGVVVARDVHRIQMNLGARQGGNVTFNLIRNCWPMLDLSTTTWSLSSVLRKMRNSLKNKTSMTQ